MTIEELERATDVPVVVADDHGLITHVNAPFESLFGWPRQEIIGKPLSVIIPSNLRDAHHLGFSRFLTTGKPTLLDQPLLLKAVTKAGRVFEAEHRIVAQQREGNWMFAATIKPVGGA